jgi:hypothetical protein
MRFRSIAVISVSILCASTVRAQATVDPQCTAAPVAVRDACQQSIDLFNYMVPQLGMAITGGNFTLAQGGALGGLPHFTLGVRVNALQGSLPDIQTPSTGGAVQYNPYLTKKSPLGLPAVDASIGLWKGLPLAVSNVGGIDLLLSVAYIPKVNKDEVSVQPKSSTQIGYGVRVGLLQESLIVPGVSVSLMKRDLPTTSIIGSATSATSNDTVSVTDLSLKTTSWRLTASKSLVLFTLAAGVGQDKVDASTTVAAAVHRTVPPVNVNTSANVKTKFTRTNYFADLSMNLFVAKLVAEIGMSSGGKVDTYSIFDPVADKARTYGAVGLRFGF